MVSSRSKDLYMTSSFDSRSLITEVVIPSLGKPYLKKDGSPYFPNQSIRISSMTVAEEKMMSQRGSDNSRKVSMLIGKTCDLAGMNPDDLLVSDQFFLLMKIRALSYGSNYGFQYKCEDCDHQWKNVVNLETDLDVTFADDDWEEPFEVTLPASGKVIKYRLLRAADEIKMNTKKFKKGDNSDPSFVSMLATMIISIDEQNTSSQLKVTESWLESLSVRDRAAFTESIRTNTPGYSGDLTIECPSCGYCHEGSLPMTAEFFRVDVSS